MRLLTLAAGLATGYVLGTRAGRPKYDQIVANARLVRANPTAGQAITALTNLFGSADAQPASDRAGTTLAILDTAEQAAASTRDKPARRRPAPTKASARTPDPRHTGP